MEDIVQEALTKGVEMHKAGQLDLAKQLYASVIQLKPRHADANHNLGVIEIDTGNIKEAIPLLKIALEENPENAQYWISSIDALIRLEEFDDAGRLLDQAIERGAQGQEFDQLEQTLDELNSPVANNVADNSFSATKTSNILDNLKLDKAIKLAKQKSKGGDNQGAKSIYADILKKFPKNKTAVKALKVLAGGASELMQDPPQEQLNSLIRLYSQGQLRQTLEKANQMLERFPNSVVLWNIAGAANSELGQFDTAIESFTQAIKIKPDYAEAYNNMGSAQQDKGDLEAAITSYKQAIKLQPDYANAYNNMGNALRDKGDLETAINSYKRAMKLKPNDANVYNNMGNALRDEDNLEAAIESYKQALKIKPDHAEAYNNMGIALEDLGDLEAAIKSYKQALKIKPDYAEAYNNIGNAFWDKGNLEAAIESYTHAFTIKPDYAQAHANQSYAYLFKRDFTRGWAQYEWRWKTDDYCKAFIKSNKPIWHPSSEQRVLLWAEQGIGDEVMFASFILELYAVTSKLIVQLDKRLIPLFYRSFPKDIDFRSANDHVSENEYDANIPMGSLAQYFRPTVESFKATSKGWLSADKEKVKDLRTSLLSDGVERLVGISWDSLDKKTGARKKTIPLNQLAQSLSSPTVKLVNLQYGDVSDEIKKLKTSFDIEILQVSHVDNKNDLDSLAALIEACDEVVSIANVTIHLAGALGKNSRVLLPCSPNWRWGQTNMKGDWYDSVKILREREIFDWKTSLTHL